MRAAILFTALAALAAETTGPVLVVTTANRTPTVGSTIEVVARMRLPPAPYAAWNQCIAFDATRLRLVEQRRGSLGIFVADSRGLDPINAGGVVRAGGYAAAGTPIAKSGPVGIFVFEVIAPGTAVVETRSDLPGGAVQIQPDGIEVVPATGRLVITAGVPAATG
jgi:hypothetical protein